jgi:hypothetical protein
MNYNIRLLEVQELHLANDLFKKVYLKDRSQNDFIWEFIDGPAGKAIYVGAFDGERLVGTQAAIPLYFMNSNGEKVLTAKSEDTLLDPEYRGKGLFDKMYSVLFDECNKAGIKSIWGFTYAKKPFLKIGFDIPFETDNAVLVFKPFQSYRYLVSLNSQNKLKDKVKILALVGISFLKQLLLYFNFNKLNKVFISNVVNDQVEFQRKVLKSESLESLYLDNSYVDWRINKNPYGNLYKEAFMKNAEDEKIASVVYNIRPNGIGYIEQILFDPRISEKDQLIFLKSVLEEFRAHRINLVRFWGMQGNQTNQNEIKLLKKCNFIFSGRGTAFVYKKLDLKTAAPPSKLLVSRLFTQGNM